MKRKRVAEITDLNEYWLMYSIIIKLIKNQYKNHMLKKSHKIRHLMFNKVEFCSQGDTFADINQLLCSIATSLNPSQKDCDFARGEVF